MYRPTCCSPILYQHHGCNVGRPSPHVQGYDTHYAELGHYVRIRHKPDVGFTDIVPIGCRQRYNFANCMLHATPTTTIELVQQLMGPPNFFHVCEGKKGGKFVFEVDRCRPLFKMMCRCVFEQVSFGRRQKTTHVLTKHIPKWGDDGRGSSCVEADYRM